MILVIGANGIVGQHLRLAQPDDLSVVYVARNPVFPRDYAMRIKDGEGLIDLLERWRPDVVLNLVGENRPDIVEKEPRATEFINTIAPSVMATWCQQYSKRFIHVSTQGVFGGMAAPYLADLPSPIDMPVNMYGWQKRAAEKLVQQSGGEIARLTFVLGVRPMPHVGRGNPMEAMLAAISNQTQVEDRYFSVCFAKDAAGELWKLVHETPQPGRVVNIGIPESMSRATIAAAVIEQTHGEQSQLQYVKHDEAFPAPKWAPRPINTTFAADARFRLNFTEGVADCVKSWRSSLDYMDLQDRAAEIALFFGMSVDSAVARLQRGFGQAHADVTTDFNRHPNKTDEMLLDWYRHTPTYIWELTAYHLDPGFNYMGMCQGVVQHLVNRRCRTVLCLGDGVGDLSMKCADASLNPIYHDLKDSQTAKLAMFRMQRRYGHVLPTYLTSGWLPDDLEPESVEGILAFDFFEHVTDVEAWVEACYRALKPGGLFVAQNAFAIGDVEHDGSMPMHLARNNRFEHDWDPLLDRLGFTREDGNWRRKP